MKGKEIIEELAAGLLVDGHRLGNIPLMAGLGGKDEVPSVGAAADHPARGLPVAEPKSLNIFLDLADRMVVRGRGVFVRERAWTFPLNDESVVNGVGAASAER